MTPPLPTPPDNRHLQVAPGTTILKAAQAGGVDITATCGGGGGGPPPPGQGRPGAALPPPPTMADPRPGGARPREGSPLPCQCHGTEPLPVEVAPPLDEQATC